MPKLRKIMLITTALVGVLLALAFVGIRGSRGSFTPPVLLKPDLAQVAGGHVSMYGARINNGIILFDAGQDPEGHAADALLATLKGRREDVHDVFLTHGHADHTAAVPLFAQARVWAGAGDVALAAGTVPPEAWLAKLMSWLMPPVAVHVTQELTIDESFAVAPGKMVRALPMPGHTAGSYAFLYDGVLFVGDTMSLEDGKLTHPVALFDPHPKENLEAIVNLRALLGSAPIDRVCTAHAGCTAAGEGNVQLDTFVRALQSELAS